MNSSQIQEHITNSELTEDDCQFLTFILNNEEYGVDILRVQEIKGWDNVTQMPDTPAYIKGIINLRGTIVPIIDLRERFNMESVQYNATTVVIVLKVAGVNNERTIGIVVDAVSDVYSISENNMKPPPDMEGINNGYVSGLATVEDKMIITLDIDQLFNSTSMPDISPSSIEPSVSTQD